MNIIGMNYIKVTVIKTLNMYIFFNPKNSKNIN